MKSFLLLTFFVALNFIVKSQAVEWERWHTTRPGFDVWTNASCTDKDGNSYIIGRTKSGKAEIVKYNHDGFIVWDREYDYMGDQPINGNSWWDAITLDEDKNLYFLDKKKSQPYYWLIKIDSSGNEVYKTKVTNNLPYYMYHLVIDKQKCVHIVTANSGAIVNDTGIIANEFLLYSKLDPAGNLLNAYKLPIWSYSMQITVDDSDNLYLCCTDLSYSSIPQQCKLRKINSKGEVLWKIEHQNLTYPGPLFWSKDGNLIETFQGSLPVFSGINKVDPNTGIVNKSVTLTNLMCYSLGACYDSEGNLYCALTDTNYSRIEIRKYDINLSEVYSTNIPVHCTQCGYEQLIIGRDKSLYCIGRDHAGSYATMKIFIDKIDSSGELILSKSINDSDLQIYEYKVGMDSLENFYFAMRIVNNFNDTTESNDFLTLGVLKYCQTCPAGSISGTVFNDVNKDCQPDSTERKLSQRLIKLLPENIYSLSDSAGGYTFDAIVGEHEIREFLPKSSWSYSCDTSYFISVDSAGHIIPGKNFGNIALESMNDLIVNSAVSRLRPGFNAVINIQYANVGTNDINAVLSLKLGDALTYLSTSDTSAFIRYNDSLVWNLGLLPFETSGSKTIFVRVDSATSLGSIIKIVTGITPLSGDISPGNNTDTLSEIVMGSYDPNEKIAYPLALRSNDTIDVNQPISFQINFQNTGTDTAFTVMVRDKIDKGFDLSSFRMLAASHKYEMRIINGRTLQWTFYNILLPDSATNETGSHGFVKYDLSPNPDKIPVDVTLKNSAEIYFDFNLPVITNTLTFIIPGPKSDAVSSLLFNFYPNPSSEQTIMEFSLQKVSEVTLQLFDILGKPVKTQNIGVQFPGVHQVDINGLKSMAPGIYLARMKTDEGYFLSRLAVIH